MTGPADRGDVVISSTSAARGAVVRVQASATDVRLPGDVGNLASKNAAPIAANHPIHMRAAADGLLPPGLCARANLLGLRFVLAKGEAHELCRRRAESVRERIVSGPFLNVVVDGFLVCLGGDALKFFQVRLKYFLLSLIQ